MCYFLGYCDNTKGYQIWDHVTSHVLIRRDVSFNEQILYGDKQDTSHSCSLSEQETIAILSNTTSTEDSSRSPANSLTFRDTSSASSSSSWPSEPTLSPAVSNSVPLTPANDQSISLPADSVNLSPLTPRTLLTHPNFQPDTPVRMRSLAEIESLFPQSSAFPPPLAQAHLTHSSASPPNNGPSSPAPVIASTEASSPVTADFSPDDPTTYYEALHSPEAEKWVHAMTEEVNSLKESKTWELVRLPDGRQAIQCKWVFKTKYMPNGNIDKFKARLVAKGYTQKAGIDYSETFSPVVKFETVRIVMAITAADDLKIVPFDIKTAFLNGDIVELLYMEQPEGFVDKDHPDYVCLLHKALYGLKQASRNWNHKFHQFLLQFGFTASDADPCAYYSSQGGQTIILLIYVDDGLICFSHGTNINHILDTMDKAFSNTRGPAGCYVGLRTTRR